MGKDKCVLEIGIDPYFSHPLRYLDKKASFKSGQNRAHVLELEDLVPIFNQNHNEYLSKELSIRAWLSADFSSVYKAASPRERFAQLGKVYAKSKNTKKYIKIDGKEYRISQTLLSYLNNQQKKFEKKKKNCESAYNRYWQNLKKSLNFKIDPATLHPLFKNPYKN